MRIGGRGRRSDAVGAGGRPPRRPGRKRRPVALVVTAWISGVLVVVVVAGALVGYVKYREVWDGIHHDAVTGLGKRPPKYNNALNILVFGSDSRVGLSRREQLRLHVGSSSLGCGCSDTIMVVHISPGRHQVTVVNIPRDTMVPTYGCAADKGQPGQENDPAVLVQINQTLSHGGPSCLIKTVEHTTGIFLDHFIQVEFTGVVKVVNDVGGVNVCVPHAIHDSHSGLNIKAGPHHIGGLTFLEFWRARYSVADGTDLKRINRDDLLLAEMLRGIIGGGVLSSPTKLLAVVGDAIRAIYATDSGLTQSDLLSIAQSFRGLSSKDVQFIEAPTQPYPLAPAQVEWAQPADHQLFSAIAHDATLPKKVKSGRSRRRRVVETVAPASVKVEVMNGTTVARLATDTAARLTARGFVVVGTPGDAASSGYTRSVIEYAGPADLPAARTLAALLPGVTLHKDPAATPGTVQLILGSSFTTLASQPSASPSAGPSASPSAGPSVGSLARNFGGITGNATCRTDARAFAP
jgi:LCP family protein required for cell wall assembly